MLLTWLISSESATSHHQRTDCIHRIEITVCTERRVIPAQCFGPRQDIVPDDTIPTLVDRRSGYVHTLCPTQYQVNSSNEITRRAVSTAWAGYECMSIMYVNILLPGLTSPSPRYRNSR